MSLMINSGVQGKSRDVRAKISRVVQEITNQCNRTIASLLNQEVSLLKALTGILPRPQALLSHHDTQLNIQLSQRIADPDVLVVRSHDDLVTLAPVVQATLALDVQKTQALDVLVTKSLIVPETTYQVVQAMAGQNSQEVIGQDVLVMTSQGGLKISLLKELAGTQLKQPSPPIL